ncbi:hypothetical protein H8N03_12580 [Ramlibacter sp. USB13]|uniref:Uncharacterized protein n=1 Tax=Ramlibacter cellulosilyticus TaxID=2764187 RepID=A0A923MTB4_9BURK|nr:hypothetical protein [Ramlibacter cellulosilyticus]MBC5783784.1 hypothetical protein [Ramlibacter cellulosilyticus]
MLLLQEVQQVEALFASGQKIEALRQTRALALRCLPGHEARLAAFLARTRKGAWQIPRDQDKLDADFYTWMGQTPPEDRNAAQALACCGHWKLNTPPDHDDIHQRDDYAYEAFVRLSRLVAPAESGKPSALKAHIVRETAVLEKIRELGHDPLRLPKADPGRPGVKAHVKKALGDKGIWAKSTVFAKTWEELRASGQLQDAAS